MTVTFYVTTLDPSCSVVLGYNWLARYNLLIDWVSKHITLGMAPDQPPPGTPPGTLNTKKLFSGILHYVCYCQPNVNTWKPLEEVEGLLVEEGHTPADVCWAMDFYSGHAHLAAVFHTSTTLNSRVPESTAPSAFTQAPAARLTKQTESPLNLTTLQLTDHIHVLYQLLHDIPTPGPPSALNINIPRSLFLEIRKAADTIQIAAQNYI
jgi:hypothetical protein